MTLHDAAQLWILCFSLGAAFLTTSKKRRQRRIGFVLGLISQPGWFYAVISADQGGQLIMACVYTVMWIRGIKNNWD